MGLQLPSANVTEVPAGPSLAPRSSARACVHFGCSSKGPFNTPTPFNDKAALASTFGTGIGVKGAAYVGTKTGADGLFIRLAKTSVSAFTSAIDKTGIVGTAVPTVSGTPNDGYDLVIVITTAGTIGTSFSYKVSKDGGATFGAPIAAAAATSLVLTGTGLTIGLTSTQTFALGDSFTLWTLPASASVLPVTTTRAASSTCVVTVTGSPEDAYNVRLEVLTGGTIGTAGILFRYSLDGGTTWSADTALGTASTWALVDGPASTELAGISLAFAAGTLDVGDVVTFFTTAPEWQLSDAQAALGVLRAGNFTWSFLHAIGQVSTTTAAGLGTLMAGWATKTKFSWALGHARDWGTYESETVWSARLVTAWASYADTRSTPAAGMTLATCPITGRINRRPLAWNAVARAIAVPPQVDIGQVSLGPLASDVQLHDPTSGLLLEHDADHNPSLFAAGFIVARSWPGEAGVFIARGNLMGPSGDLQRLADRRVLNIVDEVVQLAMRRQILEPFRRWRNPPPAGFVAGDIFEPDARRVEGFITAAVRLQVVDLGMVSDAVCTLVRTPVALAGGQWKLVVKTKLDGLAYIDVFTAETGFVDPALDAILNPAS